MKAYLPIIFLVAFAGAGADARMPSPAFEASGSNPGWELTVLDTGVAIGFGPDGLPAGVNGQSYLIGHMQHREAGGTLYWSAGADRMAISVEARAGDCTDARGAVRSHHVTVRFMDRTLEGCGSVPAPRKRH
jgi:uncharacterized membrane protein